MTSLTYDSLRAGRGKILIGGYPGGGGRSLAGDLECLKDEGVGVIVTLMDWQQVRDAGIPQLHILAKKEGFKWFQFTFDAHEAPPIERFQEWKLLSDLLVKELGNFGRIYLHCRDGKEKAALIAACLLQEQGLESTESIIALEDLGEGYAFSDAQADFIYNYPTWGLDK